MNQPDPRPSSDFVIDVEPKPDFVQRQRVKLIRAFVVTMNFFERVVEAASPKSTIDPTAPSGMNDLHAPTRARWSLRVMVGGMLLLLLWSSVGKIDQVTRAQAQIIAAERTQLVLSLIHI
jgi:hypothetical protein